MVFQCCRIPICYLLFSGFKFMARFMLHGRSGVLLAMHQQSRLPNLKTPSIRISYSTPSPASQRLLGRFCSISNPAFSGPPPRPIIIESRNCCPLIVTRATSLCVHHIISPVQQSPIVIPLTLSARGFLKFELSSPIRRHALVQLPADCCSYSLCIARCICDYHISGP